jgi:lipoate-protein ligase A
MHGEYKTPGGKLVVVDFEVIGDQLRNVEVSGDFFLYPEETLFAITASLEGLSAALDEGAIDQP